MTSVDLIESADCEEVLVVRDRAAGAVVVVAVHDTRLGPAHGGIRRWRYADLAAAVEDVVRLAQAMTCKCALAEVPAGGGKAVILDHPDLQRPAAYRLVGRVVERMRGQFFTGPDVGTTATDLQAVRAETEHVATGDGSGDLAQATATGVFAAIGELAAHLESPLAGLRVAVQGLGAVGGRLCELLHAAGARLVVADAVAERAAAIASRCDAVVLPADQITAFDCDVFAPCALGGVLTANLAVTLPARGVCGAANNILADAEAAAVLHRRGVPVVPDFVANAGGLIAGATWHLTGERVDDERIRRIAPVVRALLDRSRAENEPPHAIALRLARERVAQAGAIRSEEP